ncbi:MAG: phage/plasmid primase, P4 family [Kiritimatiellia bacterium]
MLDAHIVPHHGTISPPQGGKAKSSGLLAAALALAQRGFPVFPCRPRGKEPLITGGFKAATTDPTQIKAWWTTRPDANVGMPTGAPSGILVVDVDPRNGGNETLETLVTQYGPWPTTAEVVTGGGGRHIYFRYIEGARCSSLGAGIDIKGEGGYVLVPPSVHPSGRAYSWAGIRGEAAFDHIADAPDWIRARLKIVGETTRNLTHAAIDAADSGAPILQGQRNSTLTSIAGSMRRRGCTTGEIEAALQAINSARCRPPLAADEVRRVAESIARYDPAVKWSESSSSGERKPSLIDAPLTDSGNAERLHMLYGERFRYSHPQRQFFVWDGMRWAPDQRGAMRHWARETARELYSQAWDVRDRELQDQIIKHARRSECSQAITNMLKEVGSIPGVPVLPDELDRDPFLLNVLNGTIDLRTGELRPHRREDLLTKLCPVEYDPAARSSLWERFLDEATGGDSELREFLQRAAGYSLTGSTAEEKLFLIHGPAAAGKSTFLEAIKSSLGDYAWTADFETFVARRDVGAVRNDVAELKARRLIISIEIDEGRRLAEALVKTLIGGDTVRARFLYQEAFEFRPQFKLWLAANHAPRVRHDDDAIWRRILRVPFDHTVPEHRRDPSVKERLRNPAESGPAILAWAVEGAIRWREEGLCVPDRVVQATEQYRLDQDPLRDFIADACVLVDHAWTPNAKLRQAYEAYCQETGERRVLGARDFADCLRARGCTPSKRNGIRGWAGIGLLAQPEG